MASVLQARSTDVQECINMLHGVSPKHGGKTMDPEQEAAQEKINELLKHRGYTVWRMSEEQVRDACILLIRCDEQVRKAAAKVFSKMGNASVHAVAEQLHNEDPGVRAVAAELIGHMGKKAGKEYIEHLAKLLHDTDGIVRRAAVAAIGSVGEPGFAKAADVAKLLKDPDTDVRRLAVESLRKMETAGHNHVEAVLELLNDPAWTVRRAAVEAVGSMHKAAMSHSEAIAGLLQDDEWLVRGAAAEALGRLGENAIGHAGKIQELLSDKEWFVRNVAAEALYALGPAGHRLLEIHHEGMRSSAAEQLATRFQPPKPEVQEPQSPKNAEVGKGLKPGMVKDRRGRTVSNRSATRAVYSHARNTDDSNQMAEAVLAHEADAISKVRAQNAGLYTGMTA